MTGNSNEESPDMVTDPSDKNIANDHEWQTGYIKGNTFDDKEVKYKIVNDMTICQGDIILAKTSGTARKT